MGQFQPPRGPRVVVDVSIYQGSILGTYFGCLFWVPILGTYFGYLFWVPISGNYLFRVSIVVSILVNGNILTKTSGPIPGGLHLTHSHLSPFAPSVPSTGPRPQPVGASRQSSLKERRAVKAAAISREAAVVVQNRGTPKWNQK